MKQPLNYKMPNKVVKILEVLFLFKVFFALPELLSVQYG